MLDTKILSYLYESQVYMTKIIHKYVVIYSALSDSIWAYNNQVHIPLLKSFSVCLLFQL